MKNNDYEITYHEGTDGIRYPDLTVPEQQNVHLGKYAMMRRDYLIKHRKGTYTTLLTEGKLMEHLYQTEQEVKSMIKTLIEGMQVQTGVTEKMKAVNQIAWVQKMNNMHDRAEEIVLNNLIYV